MKNTTQRRSHPLDASFIRRARPVELKELVDRLGMRTIIFGRRYDIWAYREGQYGFTPEQILRNARRQYYLHWAHHLPDDARRRLTHAFQVWKSPRPVRDAIWNKGLSCQTLLAGHNRQFPKGTVYWPIESVQVMTLSVRRDGPNPSHFGKPRDHFDLRLHAMQLDRQSGLVKIGTSGFIEDQPHSGTVKSYDFSREPGNAPLAIPREEHEIINSALACHEALESAAVSTDMPYTRAPVFPRLYLGVKGDDVIESLPEFVTTPALKRTAMSFVLKWMRHGLPIDNGPEDLHAWQTAVVPKLSHVDPDNLEDWTSLCSAIGGDKASWLLHWLLLEDISEHEGLKLIPASFVARESLDLVMNKVDKVFVRVNDHLGRDVLQYDGKVEVDRQLGRLQVMSLASNTGNIGNYEYNFSTTEVGKEVEFSEDADCQMLAME